MKKYVISWISWFDYNLKSDIISAGSDREALLKAIESLGFDPSDETLKTDEDIKQFAFNCDGMVNAIRID